VDVTSGTGSSGGASHDLMKINVQESVNKKLDEDRDTEARKCLIVCHVPGKSSGSVSSRRELDIAFVEKMCYDVFGVDIKEGDIVKIRGDF